MNCPLCNSKSELFSTIKETPYYKCCTCKGIFMHPNFFVSNTAEKKRYQTHNNDVNDPHYQQFVNPIVSNILKCFNTKHHGLDFGSGTGPVITKLLRDANYNVTTYDPFFDNNIHALKTNYNFIACCEVIEHFHSPNKEFKLLKSLLKPKGKLFCMTDVYHKGINFENWYYKNDETHVFFYQKDTFEWIQKNMHFSKVSVQNRLIIFES
ncbi:methyltransferase domain-containing protein [Lutibacter sp.]